MNGAIQAKEGRAFFIVIDILMAMGVLMTAAAMGVLVLAAVSQ